MFHITHDLDSPHHKGNSIVFQFVLGKSHANHLESTFKTYLKSDLHMTLS
jgi:hypothetical protein